MKTKKDNSLLIVSIILLGLFILAGGYIWYAVTRPFPTIADEYVIQLDEAEYADFQQANLNDKGNILEKKFEELVHEVFKKQDPRVEILHFNCTGITSENGDVVRGVPWEVRIEQGKWKIIYDIWTEKKVMLFLRQFLRSDTQEVSLSVEKKE